MHSIISGEPISRRMYLVTQLLLEGTPILSAIEAVSSTALAHPEWDMDEMKTWSEWEEVDA
jgi:hypothetical protein